MGLDNPAVLFLVSAAISVYLSAALALYIVGLVRHSGRLIVIGAVLAAVGFSSIVPIVHYLATQ